MELLGFFRNLLNRESSEQKQERLARFQREEEDLVREQLVRLYTQRETTLAGTTANNQKMVPGGNEHLRRLSYDAGNFAIGATEDVLEAGGTKILSLIDDSEKRRKIHQEALNAAKIYWDQTLVQPDNPTDVVMLGRRRLTQITQRLEEFTRPPEAPK